MAERRVDIRVSVDDADANARLDKLAAKLDKLTKRNWAVKLTINGLDALNAKLDKLTAKLDKLGSKTVTPNIGTSSIDKADVEVDRLSLKLDKLGHKRVTPTVSIKTDNNTISRDLGKLLGGGGRGGGNLERDLSNAAGGGGAAGGGLLSALAGANNSTMGGLIAALIAYAMAIGPAIIPFGLGGLVGGGASLAALSIGKKGAPLLLQDRQALAQARAAIAGSTAPGTASPSQLLALHQAQQALAAAKTPAQRASAQAALARAQASIAGSTAPGHATPSQLLALHQAQTQLAKDKGLYGGFMPLYHQFSGVGHDIMHTFLGALTSKSPGFSAGPHGQPGGSFIQGLTPIIGQFGQFIKGMGPGLGQLFRASLPSLAAFMKIMEQLAKAVLPAITTSLRSLNTSGALPILVQGFKLLSQGIAGFIVNLGPGMKDGAIVFKGSMMVVKGILQLVGFAASLFAKAIVKTAEGIRVFAREVPRYFDKFRHETAVIFDGVRHEIAHVWDDIYSNSIGKVVKIYRDVNSWEQHMRHDIASTYDGIRHDIASYWDQIWQDTIGKVERGIANVVSFFKGLPGKVKSALGSFGSMLKTLGETALNDMWAGLKSVGSSIYGWFKSFIGGIPKDIMSFLHMSPPHPGSVFYDLGSNFMHHLEAGMKSRVSAGLGNMSGHISGNVTGWITAALHGAGAPMSWLPALQRLVSLESGGNPRAVNPTAVMGEHASGLWQMLYSTFVGAGGRGGMMGMFNPILEGIAAIRYIMGRYGSPFNIPGLFSGGYRGYASGGIITEPIFGMGLKTGIKYTFGENGIHERVTPLGGSGSGGGTVINIAVQGDTDPDGAALRIIQKLRYYKMRHGNAILGIA